MMQILSRVGWQFYRLLGPLRNLFPRDLITYWFSTRRYTQLLKGLPALAAGLLLLICVIYSWLASTSPPTAKQLLANSIAARNNGKQEVADLYLAKARRLSKETPESRFEEAQMLLAADEPTSAVEIIRGLAPANGRGYGPARVWMVEALHRQLAAAASIESPTQQQSEVRNKLFLLLEKHTEKLLSEEPNNPMALERLAMIRLDQERQDDAIGLLYRLADQSEEHRITLARVLASAGRVAEARDEAGRGAAYYREAVKSAVDEEQRVQDQYQLGFCLLLQGKFKEASVSLMDGDVVPTDPRLKQLLGETLFRWSESLEFVDRATGKIDVQQLKRRLNVLQTAVKLNKNDPRFLARLGTIASLEGEPAEQAQRLMSELVESGGGTSIIHFALGVVEMQKGNSEEAIRQFESANRLSPDTQVILNNLAFAQASGETPDLEKALETINQAIGVRRGILELEYFLYDTRGRIYLQLKRWTDAIADLELALKYDNRTPAAVHDALSTAYQNLGDSNSAKYHRSEAEKLRLLQRNAIP